MIWRLDASKRGRDSKGGEVSTSFFLWLPFGELLHGETSVKDAIFKRGPGNPEWWEHRAAVLRKYTLPSLVAQSCQSFDIWAGIARETRHLAKPVIDAIHEAGGFHIQHVAHDARKYGKAVPHSVVKRALTGSTVDSVCFINLDSDDMLLETAVDDVVRNLPREVGQVGLFRKGYALNAETMELRRYDPGNAPPPFFARVYTRDWLRDPAVYEECWGFRVPHNRLLESTRRVDLEDDQFVVVSHGGNTSSFWRRLHTRGKLGSLVSAAAKADILKRCGLCG
jgi:hypothetical protein